MKQYILILTLIALNVIVFGFAAPFMVSYSDDFLVIAGFLLIAAIMPLNYLLAKAAFPKLFKTNEV